MAKIQIRRANQVISAPDGFRCRFAIDEFDRDLDK
jgi:hypothetical protein